MLASTAFPALVVACVAYGVAAAQPQASAQDTLSALDKDGSGAVELPEIMAFAAKEGMTDANAVAAEFQSLDRDGNGRLDAQELEGMLSSADQSAPTPEASLPAPSTEMRSFDGPSSVQQSQPASSGFPQPSALQNAQDMASQATTQSQNLRATQRMPLQQQEPVQLLQQRQWQEQQYQQQTSPSTALETLNVLDKDGSGWVELAEIQEFAQSQGLSDQGSVLAEFQGLDRDGNGKLDASELQGMLANSDEPAAELASASVEVPRLPPMEKVRMPSTPMGSMPASMPVPATSQASVPRISVPVAQQSVLPSFVGRRVPDTSIPQQPLPLEVKTEQLADMPAQPLQQRVEEPLPPIIAAQKAKQLLPTHVSDNATKWMVESASKAEKIAIHAAAEVFARQAQQVLAQRAPQEEQADKLEALAKKLREQQGELIRSAATATQQAAANAVDSVLQASIDKIKTMETALHGMEAQALAKHKNAETIMASALKAQYDLTTRLGLIRNSRKEIPSV